MRRFLIPAGAAAAALLSAVLWIGTRSPRAARTARPASAVEREPGAGRPDAAATRVPPPLAPLARAAERAGELARICARDASWRRVEDEPPALPPELVALRDGTPTAGDVASAAAALGVDGARLVAAAREAESARAVAAEAASEAAEDDPAVALALRLRAQGRHAEAAEALERALRERPDPRKESMLGYALLDARRTDAARALADRRLGQAAGPAERADAAALLATACAQAGDGSCARGAIAAMRAAGDGSGASFLEGYALALQGDLERAHRSFASVPDGDLSHAVQHNLGTLDLCLGRNDQARARLARALDLAVDAGDHAITLGDLAMLHVEEGDLVRAWIAASAAVAAGGRGADAVHGHAARASAALIWGDHATARAEAEAARAADPADDLVRERCFSHEAWRRAFAALRAEADGDARAAAAGWSEVARTAPPALARAARQALRRICP